MRKRLKRMEIILIIVSILSISNMALLLANTTILIGDNDDVALVDLPADLTRDLNDKTVYQVQTEFNNANWDGIYHIFGDYAKTQVSVEDLAKEYVALKPTTGNMESFAYSHYGYQGEEQGVDWFVLFYKCRFENGNGTIKISVRSIDANSEITSIKLMLDDLQPEIVSNSISNFPFTFRL